MFSLRFILFITLVIFFEKSLAIDTLAQWQELPVGKTLISSDQMFELGFFSPGNSTKRYIGIWYKKISWHKAIWVANRENPLDILDTGPVLTIGFDGNLKMIDGRRNTVWSTNISSNSNNTIATLSSHGDFSLKDKISGKTLWESFEHPSDSLIASMKIGYNGMDGQKYELNSWLGEDDPSPGDFVLGFTKEKPPQNIMWKNLKTHWRSGPWDGQRFIGLHQRDAGYTNGFIILQDNQQGSVFASYNSPSASQIMIEVITPDGNLRVSHWDIVNDQGDSYNSSLWQAIEVFCDVYGACGPFGVCNRPKTTCECLIGFIPKSMQEWSKGNWTSGCQRRTELECAKNTSAVKGNNDGFAKLSTTKVPDHHLYVYNLNASECERQCLINCSCVAYTFVDGIGCLTWEGELLDVSKFSSTDRYSGTNFYLRLAKSELDESKQSLKLMASLITVGGVSILGAFSCGMYKCIQNRKALRRRQRKEITLSDKMSPLHHRIQCEMWDSDASQSGSPDHLPMFDFSTLAAATNDFSESNKLGAGGFGSVYKGNLDGGEEIAVKRLSNHSKQGTNEFKNEILVISKLQHRNLVRLLGYCIEGNEKLLIYEYLRNKSLDTILFDSGTGLELDWAKRFSIIEGIARGLLYLHRDSCLRIVHRDLKPSNILLDDNLNPKISDFGLARAFEITQDLANTHRVVGTLGYMSPEYAMGGLLSEKSDVFSFGVIILEIISGKRNTSFLFEEKYLNLLGYAWCLWNEGECLDFMNKDLPNSCSPEDFIKFMQIGLLCVQDHVIDRPTISAVVLMLMGDTKVPQPKQPKLYHGLKFSDLSQFKMASTNGVSITNIEGR